MAVKKVQIKILHLTIFESNIFKNVYLFGTNKLSFKHSYLLIVGRRYTYDIYRAEIDWKFDLKINSPNNKHIYLTIT